MSVTGKKPITKGIQPTICDPLRDKLNRRDQIFEIRGFYKKNNL